MKATQGVLPDGQVFVQHPAYRRQIGAGTRRVIRTAIRAPGTIQLDERRVS